MAKQYYLPGDDGGKADLFDQFPAKIAKYAALFGLLDATNQPNDDLKQQAADALYFRWLVNEIAAARGYSQGITSWKNLLRDGGSSASSEAPAAPANAAPPVVPPGIVPRFLALANYLKNHKAYTEAIGQDLGTEGAQAAGPDTQNGQPDISGANVVANEVRLPWTKGAFDAIWFEVDRDGKGFAFLAVDTVPDYADTAPFPAGGAVWKYRAIYLLNDQKVGQWSTTVSVRVG